ncbi:lipid IV(A) 3-deoxy-D-manno-octulosonic acid transferase [Solilutibacter silvestris]|uniref:3-deoxy-D-manno-octulosonic acid transferase n=1 Tax=Solilutibacter silvestris TaxID=1645665 RepID=A0A2K1Q0C2_9GAMM|nr:lipid IV(A) 3-deoxy-D-manno-octulosonic acid transferase [Lysobacter silvestris]PNS08490.1 3-deoxy-D-manno-octulosonic-acid transferase [Lysobacter silvestris]
MRSDAVERMLRSAYSAVLYLLLPITIYHLVWRGFRQRGYFQRWSERYGYYPGAAPEGRSTIWLHAVSVGEVSAAAPLVDALLDRRPQVPLVITTITPTGSERVRALWGDRVRHVYLPYDLPGAMRRFLAQFRPACALLMETELWPNLLFACHDAGIPVSIVNARLSERSLRGYQVLAPLIRRALRTVRRVCAQGHADAKRYLRLGARAEATVETGNLKYDVAELGGLDGFVAAFRAQAGARPVWIAASTHPDEETAVLAAHRALRLAYPDALMLWAPRHPERFKAAYEQARSFGFRTHSRAYHPWPAQDDAVFVVDTLGELGRFYACADAAFVGGSLQPIGGHNLLEPAAVGVPILSGPHLHNFTDIARQLSTAGAMKIVDGPEMLGERLVELLGADDMRVQMGEAGRALVVDGRGALERTWQAIVDSLPD